MFIFDISNPFTLLLMLAATILLIFLSQELKKSYISGIVLFSYITLLILQVLQLVTLAEELKYFVFILISFFSYLWVYDMEAKKLGIKSVDNSLDWFWKNV